MTTPALRHLAKRLLLTLLIPLVITGCSTLHQKGDLSLVDSEVASVLKVIKSKEYAVNTYDYEMFMAQIDAGNREYHIEQKRWFQYFRYLKGSSYTLMVNDIAKRDMDTYVAAITQSYAYGPDLRKNSVQYYGTYVNSESGWKDSDIEFVELKTEHFIIRGMPGISPRHMRRIAKEAEVAYQKVVSVYGHGTDNMTVIKLYDDAKLLMECTKSGFERDSIGGWYEFPESIKIYVDVKSPTNLTTTIAHELVHKLTLSTSTNLCAWFAEGLAVYYGNFTVWKETYIGRGSVPKEDHIRSIRWLEKQDYESLRSWEEVGTCYAMAGMVIKHIEEIYGPGKSKAILDALRGFPQRGDEGFEFAKHNSTYVTYLNKAIEKELGTDMVTFDKNWMEWMKNYEESVSGI